MNVDQVVKVLKKEFKTHKTPVVDLMAVQGSSPFTILVATILSARTKDETTAEVCSRLFKIVRKPADFEKFNLPEIEKMIFPSGFFRQKAKSLKKLPEVLREKFGGKIPDEIDDLIELPGVGRKTANLVRALAFKKPAICVDIHVHRINNRLGYVETETPEETEMSLREKLPKKHWMTYNAVFVSFGQNTCRPVNPHCSRCPLEKTCPKVGVKRWR